MNDEPVCIPCGLFLIDTGCPTCGRRVCDPFVESAKTVPFTPQRDFSNTPTEILNATTDFCRRRVVRGDLATCSSFVNFLIARGTISKYRAIQTSVDALEWAILISETPIVRIRGWVVQFFDPRDNPLRFRIFSVKNNSKLLAMAKPIS